MRDSFDALEAHRARLAAFVEALPADVVQARPAPDAWSLAQLLDHLLRVDRGLTLGGRPMGRMRAATSPLRGALLCAVLALPVRIPAPPGARSILPEPDPEPSSTLAEWGTLRATWAERLGAADPNGTAFRHPIFGPLRPAEALAFLLAHHRHHDAQVRRTLDALGQSVPS